MFSPGGCDVDDEMVGEKEEWCSLLVCGKTLPKFRWDGERMRVTASRERGRSTSTPSARDDGNKTFLETPKGLARTLLQPRKALEAAGAAARLDERISCVRTLGRGRVVFKAFILNPFPAADMIFFSIYRIMLFVLS